MKHRTVNKLRANQDNNEEPLVSIIVVTYNSALYVLETLESAKAQTYPKIELIISDDCSTDNTISLCIDWVEKNSIRFSRVELLTSEKNCGISANCNRGVGAVHGKWVKLIAGDDVLLPNCIASNIKFVQLDARIELLFSRIGFIGDTSNIDVYSEMYSTPIFFEKSAKHQFRQLLIKNRVFAPSSFIKTAIINLLEGFDERIRNMEDYPFWIKATKAGYKLFYMPETTVLYRVHTESINYNFSHKKLLDELTRVFYLYQLPNLSFRNGFHLWHIFLSLQINDNIKLKILKGLSPLWYWNKFKDHFR